jgi:glyoxylase-like metal-dependent hydrolase (beta-lactamase superfamily II)
MERAAADYVDTMTFGEAAVTLVASVRGWRFRPPYPISDEELRRAAPEADGEARLSLDMTSAHIALGGLSIVVDPGRPDAEQRARYGSAEVTPGVDAALARLGVDPASVTHVVVSHNHHDHFTGITLDEAGLTVAYPNARHLIGRADWEAPGIHDALMRRHWRPVADAGLVDLVDGDTELAPGLRAVPLPGETAGHLGLRLESGGDTFWWVGDLVHHEMELARLDWALAGSLQPAMEESRRRLLEDAAATGAVIAWAHAPFPGWGRVGRRPDGYAWRPLRPPGRPRR